MTPTSSDSRVARTRTLLQNSLSALLTRKVYNNISIQHILEHAQVSRSTFYAHFPTKNALLYSLEEQLPIQLEIAVKEEHAINLLSLLLEHAKQSYAPNKNDILAVMLPEIGYWVKKYMEEYDQRNWRKYPDLELWQTVAITSMGSLLKKWLEQGAKDRESMAVKANKLLFCCLENAK